MNREILFRGRTKYNNWVYGSLIINGFGHNIINTSIKSKSGRALEENNYEVIPETVGQFTGLLDKNGNKIFEGDIVQRIYKYEIVFDPQLGKWMGYNPTSSMTYSELKNDFEIIGNIHDKR